MSLPPPFGARLRDALLSNKAANFALILACVVVLGLSAYERLSVSAQSAQEDALPPGSAFPVQLEKGGNSISGSSLVLVVSSTCRFCEEEMPFYRQLDDSAKRSGLDLVFISLETEDVLRRFLARHGLEAPAVQSVASLPGIRGTPTVVYLNERDQVEHSWFGVLNGSQKSSLLELTPR